MKRLFTYRTDQYDFLPIYEAIRDYYPIGLPKSENSPYFDYPGIKKMEELVVDSIHNEANYRDRWTRLAGIWEEALSVKIIGTTYGQAPSFSAYVELSNNKFRDYILSKELHFAVSLLGPFYTIYGVDESTLVEIDKDGRNRYYEKRNRIVVSPSHGFEDCFTSMKSRIEQTFEGYRFVPYFIHQAFIEGLRVGYQDNEENRVYHALFNDLFDFTTNVVGEPHKNFYGLEQWVTDNPDRTDYWRVEPLMS